MKLILTTLAALAIGAGSLKADDFGFDAHLRQQERELEAFRAHLQAENLQEQQWRMERQQQEIERRQAEQERQLNNIQHFSR
jgi:hypothetical protein